MVWRSTSSTFQVRCLLNKKPVPPSVPVPRGLFFMMTNGLGAIIGGYASGAVVDAFSVYADGKLVSREWPDIWFIFAAYALVIGILFALVFKYKHQRERK